MRALKLLLGILFVLAISTGCGDSQQPDVGGVIDPYCEQMVACQWYDDFQACHQVSISATAALTHVYGSECGDAWMDVMRCETFLECDDYYGCDREYGLLDDLCS